MSYAVTATFNYTNTDIAKREGVDITRVSFDTESVMLEDVVMDAACEVLTERMNNGRDYNALPTYQIITAFPTFGVIR